MADALRALGIQKDSVIIVHSSLKSFGYMEGGAEIRIIRLMNGCMTLDKVDPETGRVFETAWNMHLHRPLYWTDGKKTVWEIACLCAMEEGKDDYKRAYEECLSLFRALSESGIVRMEKI